MRLTLVYALVFSFLLLLFPVKADPVEIEIQYPANCSENWQCTEWFACINGKETRFCNDLNKCGTTSSKPVEMQSCTKNRTTTIQNTSTNNNESNNQPSMDGSTFYYVIAAVIGVAIVTVLAVIFIR